MASTNTVFRNTVSILSIALTARVAKIVGFFAIALRLPTTDVGRYSLALAAVEVAAGLSDFGVDWVVIRRLALHPQDRGRIVASSIAAKLALSAAAYAGAVGAAFALGFGAQTVFLSSLAGLSLFARSVTNSLVSPLQANLRMSRLVRVNFVAAVFYLGAMSAVLWLLPSLPLLILILVAADALLLTLTLRITKTSTAVAWPPGWRLTRDLLMEAVPLGISGVFVTAYFRLDTLILGKIAGLASVGFYSVAYRSTESFLLLAGAFGSSLYPLFSAAGRHASSRLAEPFRQTFSGVVSGMSLVCLLVSTYAEPVIAHLAPRYLPSAFPIAILIWSALFMFANTITGVTINSLGWHRVFLRITAINLGVNIALNVLLIPRWQIVGASVATVATEMANFIQQAIVLRKVTGLRVHLVWFVALMALAGSCLLGTVYKRSALVLLLSVLLITASSYLLGYYRYLFRPLRLARDFDVNN